MIESISENIVEIGIIFIVLFFISVVTYGAIDASYRSDKKYEICIAADKQWIQGNCVE